MEPVGTVRSTGPSLNLENDFSRPRISIAFACMHQLSLSFYNFPQKLNNLPIAQARFTAFTRGFLEQLPGSRLLHLATAAMPHVGDESAEALPSINDSFALQLFVGPLDGDDADQQVLSQSAE